MSRALDEIDFDILHILQQDGRITNTKIAAKLGINEKNVRKRIKQMIENGCVRIVPWIDYQRLGYKVDAIITIQADPVKAEEIAKKVTKLPGVHYACIASGEYDIFVIACFRSNSDLLSFLRNRIAPIDGIIHIQTYVILDVVQTFLGWVPSIEKGLKQSSESVTKAKRT